MKSPIAVLWGKIVYTFENIDSSSLRMHIEATNSGKLSKAIAYDYGQEKVKTPYAKIKTRKIHLQETYLSHLWSFIYSVLVMYEEGIQKPLINNTFNGSLEFDSPLLQRAKMLFNWSISLTQKYSEWDESLPNPQRHNFDKEKDYAEKVNGIFQSAVAYLMFHEFAHLTQGHDSFFMGLNRNDLNEAERAERAERVQIENEADHFAFDMLIKQQDDDKQRWIKGLSILFVICSALLIVPTAQGVKQNLHPDLDQRILNILQRLNLETEESQFYCWYLCGFAIRFYLIKHSIELEVGEYETAQEAFFSYLDKLDEIKSSNGI